MNRAKSFSLAIALPALGLACLFGPCISTTRAAVYSWADVGSNWSDASNWGGTAPGSADIGLFNLGSYAFQPNVTSASVVGGIWDNGAGAITITGSELTLHAALINGNYATGIEMDPGTGPLTISAPLALSGAQVWLNNSGTLAVQGNVVNNGYTLSADGIGSTSISGAISGAGGLNMIGSGILQLSGSNTYSGVTIVDGGLLQMPSGALASLTQYVGYNFSGVVSQAGAVNAGATLYLGYSPGSNGGYNLSGGLLATPTQNIGWSGNGSFVQTGGTNSCSNYFALGLGTGAIGTCNVSAGLFSASEIYVGAAGSGTFTQSDGTVSAANDVYVGYQLNASGTYSLSGGSFAPNYLAVGFVGNGLVAQSGGTCAFGNFLETGVGGSGTYSMTGGQVAGYELNDGVYGSGSFSQSGGLVSATNAVVLGFESGSAGAYSLSRSGTLSTPFLVVGYFGFGTFTQTGGTNSVGGLFLTSDTGSVAIYTLNGGLLSIAGGLESGSGAFAFSFGGGTLQATDSWATDVPVALSSAGQPGTIDTDGNTLVLAGQLSGPGGLTLADSGGGLLILATSNSYRGGTTISSGSLQIGDPLALGTGGLTVNGGTLDLSGYSVTVASLSGAAGTITNNGGSLVALTVSETGKTTFGGTIQDGTAQTALTLAAGKLILIGTDSYTGGTTVSGGTLVVASDVALAAGTNLTVGDDSFFAPVVPSAVESGRPAPAISVNPVPEPGTILLLITGACLFAAYRTLRAHDNLP